MKATETLKYEHEVILMVLKASEDDIQTFEKTGKVNRIRIEKMVDFFRNFADSCHHAKEEKLLFVKMNEKGISSDGGPIAIMLNDHEIGRGYIRAIAKALEQSESGDSEAVKTIFRNLKSYVNLLRAHINKENYILFPMADKLLKPEDQKALSEAFEKVESEETGEGVHEKYLKLAHELTRHND